MAYVPLIEYAHVTDVKIQTIYDQISRQLGFDLVPNRFNSMASMPDLLAADWHKFRALLFRGFVPRLRSVMRGVAIFPAHPSQYACQGYWHRGSALGSMEATDNL